MLWMRPSLCRRLECGIVCLALAVPAVSEVAASKQFQPESVVQPPEVRVEEPLPSDLVVPPEPLPAGSENLEPLPAESLPAEPGAPSPDSAGDAAAAQESELLETVLRWAEAWGDQRAEFYLSFYADGFEPPQEMSRWEWESQRRQRLSVPAFIQVTIEAPMVRRMSESRSQVEFIQRYESDRYRDTVRKILHLTRKDDRWKILREQAEALAGS